MAKAGHNDIAAQLRKEIIDGQHATGSVLPPVPELAARFRASESLVSIALQQLAADGLIRPERGRGTTVTWIPPRLHSPARFAQATREGGQAKGAFDAEIKAIGLVPTHEITVERAAPPAEIAELLGLAEGQDCLVRRRRLLASGIPMVLNATWIPWEIAEGTVLETPEATIVGGVKSALSELGFPQVAAHERIEVRRPTEDEVDALEINLNRTVIDIVHAGRTAEGRVVEVTAMVTPAHYLVIESDFPLT